MNNLNNKLNSTFSLWSFALIFLFINFSMTSCFKDRIDLDLNQDNKKVVITSWITNLDEPQFVKLTHTTNYLETSTFDGITGAQVDLISNLSSTSLIENSPGVYYLPPTWTAEIGASYELKVQIEDEVYSATSIMNECPEIENMYIEDVIEDGDTLTSVFFGFQDIEGEGDGYFGRDYRIGELRKDSLSNGSFVNDEFIDGIYFEEITLSEVGYTLGDTVIVDIYSIGIEASLYLTDIESEIFRGFLFDPPPVNIRTNFTNGALGYFILGGADRDTIIIN